VIMAMSRVRIMGPRERLEPVLAALQDTGIVHLAPPPEDPPLLHPEFTAREARLRGRVLRLIASAEGTLTLLGADAAPGGGPRPPEPLPAVARRIRRVARSAQRARARLDALEEEAATLGRYEAIFRAFEPLLATQSQWTGGRAWHVVLRAGQQVAVEPLREQLALRLASAFEIRAQPLPAGETALLILAPAHAAPQVEALLADGRISEVAMPGQFAGQTLARAMPAMLARIRAIPAQVAGLRRELQELRRREEPALRQAVGQCRDLIARLDARGLSRLTRMAFVLEGWIPSEARDTLTRSLAGAFGDLVVVEEIARDRWTAADAPVVLRNPRIFRPFELLIGLLPLPRYGSIDPTPFVAVFFPMFFGLILGDVGYGALLLLLGLVLHHRATPDGLAHRVAAILITCAAFALIFGVFFGEFFGDLGRRWLGLHPVWFDREEAIVPFLMLAVALGAVHMLLGLVIGAVSAFHEHRRTAIGRGLTAVMLLLVIVALLASVRVLPHGLLTPAAIALLAVFPVTVIVEGLVAPVEFLSTLGRVLSYARIMALGTASVMLAVVANRMAGAFGSVLVGVVFALLFHVVNFALGVFSPAIHALRLHYVEFFGTFYSPGGVVYRPFSHWSPARGRGA